MKDARGHGSNPQEGASHQIGIENLGASRLKEVKAELRGLRREMKQSGIPVRSCFNGGHSPESYRVNARLFALKTELKNLTKGYDPHAA